MDSMLDRVKERKLQGTRELLVLLHSWIDAIKSGDGGEDELAAIADHLVDEAIGLKQSLQRQWDYHWALGLAGRHQDLATQQDRLWRLLADVGQTIGEVAALARQMVDRAHRDVARLAEFEKQAGAFPLWVEECKARWEMLSSAPKPLNQGMAERAREEYRRGEYDTPQALRGRLERGEALGQE